jgi:hypothetical protein
MTPVMMMIDEDCDADDGRWREKASLRDTNELDVTVRVFNV